MEAEIKTTIDSGEQILSFFNETTGAKEASSPENNALIQKALSFLSADELKKYIKKLVTENEINKKLSVCLASVISEFSEEKVRKTMESMKGLSFLGETVSKTILSMSQDSLRDEVLKELRHECDKFLVENYGTLERKIVLKVNDNVVNADGEIVHNKFETVLKFVQQKEPVFLVGPAGSGKNVICKQVAKALGLDFYFSNAVTQEYKITGFTDAMGVFHETQFYKAFKNGGLFFLDEIDASVPDVLVVLNAALANGYFDFPAPIGYVEAHPDFRVVAAGNTYGYGASMEYVGRTQIDAATLDRFSLVEIGYDEQIENYLANGDQDIVKLVHAFREACEKSGVRFVVSYRGIKGIARMKDTIGIEEAIKSCLVKGMSAEGLRLVLGEFHGDSSYKRILESLC